MVRYYPTLNRPTAPAISICIANYNGVQVLGDCIESLLNQQANIAIEIIIHDDASSDGSVEWIRQHYPCVELLAADKNAGFCVANNRMVAHARGDYVLLLNNDAALFPDALATLLSASNGLPVAGIISLPQYDWKTGHLVDRGCLLDPFYNPVPNLEPSRKDVGMVIGACMFMPRALWNTLGGFPEWMGSLAEDMYLCCVARLCGHPVIVTASSGYRHHQGASFGGNRVNSGKLQTTYRRRALSERNKTAILLICTPGPLVWLLLLLHCCLLAAEGLILALLKHDAILWRQVYVNVFVQLRQNGVAWRIQRLTVQRRRIIQPFVYWKKFVCVPRKLIMLFRHGIPELR
ncbi:glycosyltransferase family 2 protein [Simplicispira lacusdiani]|uniref:glycosyltransferase family 2 protein n=1 Tax=Simplicispira lacusdiani TaxID=2213010 RepID=UPI000E75A8F2|nr:glycosyltransferase [Simplicispira lacusdiani]